MLWRMRGARVFEQIVLHIMYYRRAQGDSIYAYSELDTTRI